MSDKNEKDYVLATFDTVAKAYDEVEFFKTSANNIIDMVDLKAGDKVLDVACGTGNVILKLASAFPKVDCTGVDIAQAMLDVAIDTAKSKSLHNTNFICQDIEQLNGGAKYNLITCSYALFFLPNPIDTLKTLVNLLDKDGMLIFTSFTEQAFEPSSPILIEALQSFGIALEDDDKQQWKELRTEEDIRTLCEKSGFTPHHIETRAIRYPLSIQQWWNLKMSTGYRGMIDELKPNDFETVKENYFREMEKHSNQSGEVGLIADTLYTKILRN